MKNFFEGLYFKHCSGADNAAFIFARQACGEKRSAFIQLITEDDSHCVRFDYKDFLYKKPDKNGDFEIKLGNNAVSGNGLTLNIKTENLTVEGNVKYGGFTPLKYDIMGPFKILPFMECTHTVLSMRHALSGGININNKIFNFDNGIGYAEGDKGKSFPEKYFWTQCNHNGFDIFVSVATIPYLRLRFNGVICQVNFDGKGYRLSTYLGARAKRFNNNFVVIEQGAKRLEIEVLKAKNEKLIAPNNGEMNRVVKESVKTAMRYKLSVNNKVIFDFISENAACEYGGLTESSRVVLQ